MTYCLVSVLSLHTHESFWDSDPGSNPEFVFSWWGLHFVYIWIITDCLSSVFQSMKHLWGFWSFFDASEGIYSPVVVLLLATIISISRTALFLYLGLDLYFLTLTFGYFHLIDSNPTNDLRFLVLGFYTQLCELVPDSAFACFTFLGFVFFRFRPQASWLYFLWLYTQFCLSAFSGQTCPGNHSNCAGTGGGGRRLVSDKRSMVEPGAASGRQWPPEAKFLLHTSYFGLLIFSCAAPFLYCHSFTGDDF